MVSTVKHEARPHPVTVTATLLETVESRRWVNNEKLVDCFSQGEPIVCELHDGWKMTPVEEGDTIHLISTLVDRDGTWHTCIDLHDGFLILCPDILISGQLICLGNV